MSVKVTGKIKALKVISRKLWEDVPNKCYNTEHQKAAQTGTSRAIMMV
jgi:hypothetical protein